jgi:CBS domain containing-hemolysin-like protein
MGEDAELDVEILPDGSVRVDGLTPISDLEARFALIVEDGEAETVGGYVLEKLGRVPAPGEEIGLGPYTLSVVEMDGPRVAEVLLRRGLRDDKPQAAAQKQESDQTHRA